MTPIGDALHRFLTTENAKGETELVDALNEYAWSNLVVGKRVREWSTELGLILGSVGLFLSLHD